MGYTTHKGKLAIYSDSRGDYVRENGIRRPLFFTADNNNLVTAYYIRKDGKKGWEDIRADKHKYNNWKQQFNALRDMFRGDTNGYYQFRLSSLDNAFLRRNAVPLIEPRSSLIYLLGTKVGSSLMYNNYLA